MVIQTFQAEFGGDVVKLANTRDLKSRAITVAYGFESHHPHHDNRLKIPLDSIPQAEPLQIAELVYPHPATVFYLSTVIHMCISFRPKSENSVSFLQCNSLINRLNAKGGLR